MYMVALFIYIIIYALVIHLMKYMKNTKIANLVFGSIISISYISLIISIYFECGYDTWNFQNQMPTANVSPFMFFIVPIILILPLAKAGFKIFAKSRPPSVLFPIKV